MSGHSEITRKIITRTLVILLSFILGIAAFGYYSPAAYADAGPDLIVQSISLSPDDPLINDTVTITAAIKNQGTSGAGGINVACYVDSDLKGTKSVNPLGAGATAMVTFTWKAAVGSHTIMAFADSSGLIEETNENNNKTTYTISPVAPDLIINSITWSPDNPSRGDSITFSILIKNQGSVKSHNTNVHLYIDGITRGFQDIAAIDPAGSITATFYWTALTGQHTVRAIVDEPNNVRETNEMNNELEVPFETLQPDLAINSITWWPEEPLSYEEVTFTVNVTNQGSGRADGCFLAYYIGDVYQTLIPVSAIDPGFSSNLTFTWTAFDNSYTVRAIIDFHEEVAESDETNNEQTVSLLTLPPDLVLDDLTWTPSDAAVGDDVTFTATIKNQGDGRADPSHAVFYIDGESSGHLDIPGIDVGGSATATTHWLAEKSSHVVSAVADYDNQLDEISEDNNKLTKTIPIIPPDLVISGIATVPGNPSIGDTITFTVTVKNQGGGNAAIFKVAYFIDDALLNKEPVYHLAYDTSANTTFTWKSESGHHTFKALVDCENNVTEGDEDNNESSITVSPNMPDLAVADITWSPFNMPVGSSVTFNVNIKNLGTLSTVPSRVAYYVDDAIVSDTDIGPLDAGATATKHFNWIAMEGHHKIKIVADSNNRISEIDEINNTKVANLPPPDLIVQDITCSPSDAKIGDNVTITATVKNQGTSQTQTSQVVCDIDGLRLASLDLPEIGAGGSVARAFKWVAREGVHSLKITSDIGNLVTESDETNNIKEIKFSTLTRDLVVKNIGWFMENPLIYDEVHFTITVKNQGTGAAAGSQLKYFIDETPAILVSLAALPAGGTAEYKFDSTLKRGPHKITAAIDVNSVVIELDETNNSAVLSFSTTVPDLIVKSIACTPQYANVADNVTITVKAENQGREKAIKPRLALSIDKSIVGYVDIPEINMGATATANFTWKALAGLHEISIMADAGQTILESNETNNTRTQTITIGDQETPTDKPGGPSTGSSAGKGFIGSYWWLLVIGAALLGAIALMSALRTPKKK